MTLDLEAIKARAEAATPGPWSCGSEQLDDTRIQSADGEMTIYDEGGHTWKDADFIAHAITDVPALVAEVERLSAIGNRVAGWKFARSVPDVDNAENRFRVDL